MRKQVKKFHAKKTVTILVNFDISINCLNTLVNLCLAYT